MWMELHLLIKESILSEIFLSVPNLYLSGLVICLQTSYLQSRPRMVIRFTSGCQQNGGGRNNKISAHADGGPFSRVCAR